jgi:uncharacterized DUF497 family protein
MDFEWEAVKAAENAAKHGVTFVEAAEVFADDLASTVADRIRIISARPMTRRERRAYER